MQLNTNYKKAPRPSSPGARLSAEEAHLIRGELLRAVQVCWLADQGSPAPQQSLFRDPQQEPPAWMHSHPQAGAIFIASASSP